MGFFSNLFKRNKPKMIEAPKDENEKETKYESIQVNNNPEIGDEKSQYNSIEDDLELPDEDKRKVIICHFDQALKEYDDWYSTTFHEDEEKYRGAIDIITNVKNEIGEKSDLVILNYRSAITKKQEKIVLAIAKVTENSSQKYLRKSIDQMIYEIYNGRVKNDNDLQKKMDEIREKIFDIEFTYEGSQLLLNKGGMVDKTVEVDNDSNGIIMDYRKIKQYNTFGKMRRSKTIVEITVKTIVKKLDERDQKNYVKKYYINDIIKLGKIAETIGLIRYESEKKDESEIEDKSKNESEQYNNALKDAMIIVKNSAYAPKISGINSLNSLLTNEDIVRESLREIIGDIIYYENVIEEEINKRDYNDPDRDVLVKILAFGKAIMTEREEKAKQQVINGCNQNGVSAKSNSTTEVTNEENSNEAQKLGTGTKENLEIEEKTGTNTEDSKTVDTNNFRASLIVDLKKKPMPESQENGSNMLKKHNQTNEIYHEN